jgi:xylulose-5-phosphate/fructose-6-phosphate phosphoketolase
VRNERDRCQPVMATSNRLPQTGLRGIALKQRLADKPIDRKAFLAKHGEDLPEMRN